MLARREIRPIAAHHPLLIEQPDGVTATGQLRQHGGDAAAGGAGADDQHRRIGQGPSRLTQASQHTGRGDGRRALDVVIEHAQLIAVARQQVGGMLAGKVFKLQHHLGPAAANGGHHLVHEVVVSFPVDARRLPAEVGVILQQLGVVGAHVDTQGQGTGRIYAAGGAVEGQLADADPHAADAEIAEAKHPLSVGDDDDIHLLLHRVEDGVEIVPVVPREVEAVAAQVEIAVALARLPHHRGVDDGQELRQVVAHQVVEEHRVVLLQLTQQQMLIEWALHGLYQSMNTAALLGQRLLFVGHAPHQAEAAAVGIGQAGAHQGVVHDGLLTRTGR